MISLRSILWQWLPWPLATIRALMVAALILNPPVAGRTIVGVVSLIIRSRGTAPVAASIPLVVSWRRLVGHFGDCHELGHEQFFELPGPPPLYLRTEFVRPFPHLNVPPAVRPFDA